MQKELRAIFHSNGTLDKLGFADAGMKFRNATFRCSPFRSFASAWRRDQDSLNMLVSFADLSWPIAKHGPTTNHVWSTCKSKMVTNISQHDLHTVERCLRLLGVTCSICATNNILHGSWRGLSKQSGATQSKPRASYKHGVTQLGNVGGLGTWRKR